MDVNCPGGEMVDTGDLKSPGHCVRAGSSPAPGTTYYVVPSPSGKAAACKAAIPGSNPGGTSNTLAKFLSGDGRAVEYTGLENRRG
jgi:hypothetical protein